MNLRFGLLRSVAGRSPASGHDWLCWSWWSYLPKWRPTRLIQSHVDRECWQDTGARADSRAYGLSDALTDSKYWVDFDDLFFYRIGVLDVGIGAQEAEMTSVDRLGLHLLGNGRS